MCATRCTLPRRYFCAVTVAARTRTNLRRALPPRQWA
jgi:hypothetical protein